MWFRIRETIRGETNIKFVSYIAPMTFLHFTVELKQLETGFTSDFFLQIADKFRLINKGGIIND